MEVILWRILVEIDLKVGDFVEVIYCLVFVFFVSLCWINLFFVRFSDGSKKLIVFLFIEESELFKEYIVC